MDKMNRDGIKSPVGSDYKGLSNINQIQCRPKGLLSNRIAS
jgi:hypothetical protein